MQGYTLKFFWMRNILVKDDKTTIEFLDEIINSKKNRTINGELNDYRGRINILRPILTDPFDQFNLNHDSNTLENLVSIKDNLDEGQIVDLIQLYTPSLKKIVDFKKALQIDENIFADTTCQYCTISSGNTIDHILPQSCFPEFVVNHKNLLPICGRCNTTKNKFFINDNGEKIFLNLYTDILPNEQYLFVDLQFTDNLVTVNFYLNNINNIEVNLYDLINRHFTALDLLSKFKEQSVLIIKEFQNSITPLLNILQDDVIIQVIKQKIDLNKPLLGSNHYKNILEQKLIEHPDFFDWLRQIQ